MAKTINCGIIGCGVIAPSHILSYQYIEDIEITWVCDTNINKAKKLAEEYNIKNVTDDYMTVLNDSNVDSISICTDHASHSNIAVKAIEHSKHILCEKPLSSNKAGLENMINAHQKRPDLVFSGVFQHRFDPVYRLIKTYVHEGYFGKILLADLNMLCLRSDKYYHSDNWRGTWLFEGGSLLINQSIHFIDQLNWIMGGVKDVFGSITNVTHQNSIETEDSASAILKYKNGAMGTISATSSSHINWQPTITISGTEGTVEIVGGKITKLVFENKDREYSFRKELDEISKIKEGQAQKDYYGPSHPTQVADFIDSIRNSRAPFVTAESAASTVDIVLAVYQSDKEQKWISTNL